MEFYAHTWGLSDSPTLAIKLELNRLGGFLFPKQNTGGEEY